MKKTILLSVCFVILSCFSSSAQYATGGRGSFGGCPKCGVISYIDYPIQEATVEKDNFVIAGWGFECMGGALVERVDVFYEDYDGYYHSLKQQQGSLITGIVRQDVMNAYSVECPNIPSTTGWHLYLNNPPPAGLRRLTINVWYGPYFEQHRRIYLVK